VNGQSRKSKTTEESMTRNHIHAILLSAFALVAALAASRPAAAQDAKQPHATMAPLDQYLMDRDAEIALARSAAPDSIPRDADVLVLGRHCYALNSLQGIAAQFSGPDRVKPALYVIGSHVLEPRLFR
jgi:hypothetical protein